MKREHGPANTHGSRLARRCPGIFWLLLLAALYCTDTSSAASNDLAGASNREQLAAQLEALKSPDPLMRERAAGELWQLGVQAGPAVPELSAALWDDSLCVAMNASRALGVIGAEGVPALRGVLAKGEPARIDAVLIGMKFLNKAAAPAIPELMALLTGPDDELRRKAAWILSHAGPEAETPAAAALNSPNPMIRRRAAFVLSHLSRLRAESQLGLMQLLQDPEAEVRLESARALQKPGEMEPAELLPALRQRLEDSDVWVRLMAERTVRLLSQPAAAGAEAEK